MSKKRSIISPERLKHLNQGNSVYSIFCGADCCTCDEGENVCGRGFFSLFIQALYGIQFAQNNGLPYYVDFGTRKYLYSDPEKEGQNFWNYYFLQPFPEFPENASSVGNLNIEVHPLRIWNRQHFLQIHREVVSKLQYRSDVLEILERKKKLFKRSKVLGVQIRCTDHAVEILPVRFEKIMEEIEKRISRYDKLFVATDDSRVVSLLQEQFGPKLMYNEAVRSNNRLAVHMNTDIKNRYKLGLEVLVDCYCLSLCEHAILLQSNISYSALLFNPLLSYTLLERTPVRLKKLKTLLLYYLNKFKIRKW